MGSLGIKVDNHATILAVVLQTYNWLVIVARSMGHRAMTLEKPLFVRRPCLHDHLCPIHFKINTFCGIIRYHILSGLKCDHLSTRRKRVMVKQNQDL